jgi:FtsZ-interacting cell division protein ZipA
METLIIILVIGAIVVLLVALFVGRRMRDRRLEGKRVEATELRQEADERARHAAERESLAEEQAERARRERAEAEAQARRADEIDPDADT